MKQYKHSINPQSFTDNRAICRVAVVTTDRSTWVATRKVRWIFWLSILLGAAILFGSCKNSGASDSRLDPSDTAGLAAFNAQKAADSIAALNGSVPDENDPVNNGANQSFTSGSDDGTYGSDADNGAIKSVNDDNAGGDYADDYSGGAAAENTETAAGQTSSSTDATTTKKRKFSSASKGAVIGAGSGAVLGAIISKKNRGLGAVIGAAVGGGAGYGIGKHQDNKREQEGQ